MQVSAIVVAAGFGLRLKSNIPKPLIRINSQPSIIYCLKVLARHPSIKDIIVVVNPVNLKGIYNSIKQYRIAKIKDLILGGKKRRDSVFNGLKAVSLKSDLVLIHDGVRPFINRAMVSAAIKEAQKYGAAVVGMPVKATVKQVTRSPGNKATSWYCKKTLKRDKLWEAQTPQVFKRDLILRAYKKYGRLVTATDDAALVERLGCKVRMVRGSYANIKITTPEDLIFAQAISAKYKRRFLNE